jgi:hypothetical protein
VTTSNRDGEVRLWDVALPNTSGAIRKICRAVHRNLTGQERLLVHLPDQSPGPVCPS